MYSSGMWQLIYSPKFLNVSMYDLPCNQESICLCNPTYNTMYPYIDYRARECFSLLCFTWTPGNQESAFANSHASHLSVVLVMPLAFFCYGQHNAYLYTHILIIYIILEYNYSKLGISIWSWAIMLSSFRITNASNEPCK